MESNWPVQLIKRLHEKKEVAIYEGTLCRKQLFHLEYRERGSEWRTDAADYYDCSRGAKVGHQCPKEKKGNTRASVYVSVKDCSEQRLVEKKNSS